MQTHLVRVCDAGFEREEEEYLYPAINKIINVAFDQVRLDALEKCA